MKRRKAINLILSLIGPIALVVILTMPIGPLAGGLGILQPVGGIFDNGGVINEPEMQSIPLPGLDADVEVLVDEWGIPHIYAESTEDAMKALGYMHAKDRLFQLVMQKHFAAGRISEIVGAYASSSDMFYRAIGLERSAQETLDWYEENAATSPDVELALSAIYAETAGINAFIHSMTSSTMPIEFKILGYMPEDWRPVDCFTAVKTISWGLSGGVYDLQRQWIRQTLDNDSMYNELFPDLMPYTEPIIQEQVNLSIADYPLAPGLFPAVEDPDDLVSLAVAEGATIALEKLEKLVASFIELPKILGDEVLVGSNNWAVDGNKSETGYPIVAGDPHLSFQAPSVWYEAHIVVEGELDVTGTSFPGLPAILIGHNANAAWSFTNVGADMVDIFVEQLAPGNSDMYMYNGEYRELSIHDETIHTKEGIDIEYTVKESVHGPLVDSAITAYGLDSEAAPNLAMNWTGSGVTHEIIAATKFMRADNLTEFMDAMYYWDSPPQNCVYGDVHGDIAMLVVGRFPIRVGYTGEYPIVALNDSVGMLSNIPYAYNPREINPARGFVSSANQRTIDPNDYGFNILGPQADGYRGRRIFTLLTEDTSVTVDDMKRFQADSLEVRAQEIVPYVVAAWEGSGEANATVDDIVAGLDTWSYIMDPDLVEPTVWMYLREAIHYETFDELWRINSSLPLSRTPILEELVRTDDSSYFDDKGTAGVIETRDDILVKALYSALDTLAADWADEPDWKYGNWHRVYVNHLAGLTYIGGEPHRGQNTLNNAANWNVRHGPSTRLIADMSNIQQCYMAYPGGQSGNMFSPHWDDNFNIWFDFNPVTQQYGYHLMYFYGSADAFRAADTDGSRIERTITLTA